jgi:tetratricopeptide (TPR) repeat protein
MTIAAAEPRDAKAMTRWSLWIGLALLAWVAWRVLGLGVADALANHDPAAALAWRSDQKVALLAQAQARLAAGDLNAVDSLARRALLADPSDGLGYRLMAETAVARGRPDEAFPLYRLASARSPRDLHSRAWLAARYLQAQDYRQVLAQIDTVLRIEPELDVKVAPDLIRLAAVPAAQTPLLQLLQRRPPWRSDFVIHLSQRIPDIHLVAGLMERLRHGSAGLSDSELSAWLDRLIHDRQWEMAYLTWAEQLPKEKQRTIGNVFDGGFDWLPSNGGFDWRVDRVPGAHTDRVETAGASNGYALRIAFDGQRVPFNHVRQMLALAPGDYRLEGRARLDALDTDLGLIWQVECAQSGKKLAGTEPFLGNAPWRPFSLDFTVPAEDCGGQWLRLLLPARIPAEQRIGGVAWFDDLKITRQSEQ